MDYRNDYMKLLNIKYIIIIYVLATIAVSLHLYLLPLKTQDNHLYATYNNYLIFKQTFFHLINGENLYSLNRYEHLDYYYWDYKYSPTFALYMAPFYYLPNWIGLLCWNMLNSFVLLYGIIKLKVIEDKKKVFLLLFILIEHITALQNAQSNSLIAGLIILSYGLFENKKFSLGIFLVMLAVFIKPFAIASLMVLICYSEKLQNAFKCIIIFVFLTMLPLVAVSFNHLQFLYESWSAVLGVDHDSSYGISVMGCISSWFSIDFNKNIVLAIGTMLLLLPLLKYKLYNNLNFRLLIVVLSLIWMVIFNHKAESPTFIIAVTGCAIWFFVKINPSKVDRILLILLFVFTVLSPSDIFPAYIRHNYIVPYSLKALPCIFIFIKAIIDLFYSKLRTEIISKYN